MIIQHDIHVHTYISSCGKPTADPNKYIELAIQSGFHTLGFADHLWDSDVPGASPWYAPQNMEHLNQIRGIVGHRDDIRILFGCETEYAGGRIAITREHAQALDYVLVPISHLHMKDFVRPAWCVKPKDLAELMVKRFNEVVVQDIATGIPHPFVPCGFSDNSTEILSYISNDAFDECFGLAKEHNVSIEIHPEMYTHIKTGEYVDCYCRMMERARGQGCCFHFGSDAHDIPTLRVTDYTKRFLAECGFREQELLPLVRAEA